MHASRLPCLGEYGPRELQHALTSVLLTTGKALPPPPMPAFGSAAVLVRGGAWKRAGSLAALLQSTTAGAQLSPCESPLSMQQVQRCDWPHQDVSMCIVPTSLVKVKQMVQ